MADRVNSACKDHNHSYLFVIYPKNIEVTMDGTSEGQAAKKIPVIFGTDVTKAVAKQTGTIYKY